MTNSLFLYPIAAHIALTAFLYVLLTIVRAPAVWGLLKNKKERWAAIEPRLSANLSNQFEWPLFFHITCVLLIVFGNNDSLQLWLAWIFVAGRLIHSAVQILTNNIRLRGLVFTINFLAVLAMWFFLLV